MKQLLTLLLVAVFSCKLSALIIEAPNLEKFEKTLQTADQHTLVLFDVDDTLLIPKDLILKSCAQQRGQEILKKIAPEKSDFTCYLCSIFSNMEYEVVNPKLVDIVHSLQKRGIKTIAFTKMHTGPCGTIPSLEDWRLAHLKLHDFEFDSAFPEQEKISLDLLGKNGLPARFKQGLLCANGLHKGPVFMNFLEKISWKPTTILFLDDRKDYLESMESLLKDSGITFIGFHYTEVANRPCVINEALAEFQLRHLAQTGEWLGDAKALALMKLPCLAK